MLATWKTCLSIALVMFLAAGCIDANGSWTEATPTSRSPSSAIPSTATTIVADATSAPEKVLTPCSNSHSPASFSTISRLSGVLGIQEWPNIIALGGYPLGEKSLLTLNADEWAVGFSPKGKWFAYVRRSPSPGSFTTIQLISEEGEQISHSIPSILPASSDAKRSGDWLSVSWINDALMLVMINDGTESQPTRIFFGVLDPAAGQWKQSLLDTLPSRYDQGRVAFSPDLTRVMYVETKDSGYSLVLWDIDNRKELWRKTDLSNAGILGGQGGNMAWSSDSTMFAFSDWISNSGKRVGRLYTVDRDGKHSEILDPLRSDNMAWGLSWSPNERYLAAISNRAADTTQRAAVVVYEASTGQGLDICPLSENDVPLNNIPLGSIDLPRFLRPVEMRDSQV